MTISHFSFPTTVHFGAGASKMTGVHLRDRKLRRPLIVTDKALAALPVMKHFVAHLDTGLDVGIFNGVQGNPTAAQVMAGQAAYKAHRADCVIGFGGGAALDVAKVVALMAVHDGHVMEYVWDHPQVKPIVNELPYFVAVPTTSGTGSEVGRSSVVSDDATHVKRVVFSPKLLAKVVFADPELTFDLPPAVTAATGMDALTHNIESYLSPGLPPAVRRHRAGRRPHRRAGAGGGREGRTQPAGARRHDDVVDDGRDRVPEGPRRRALVRARARRRVRPAPRARQRADARAGDALQPRSGRGQVRRTRARGRREGRRGLHPLARRT